VSIGGPALLETDRAATLSASGVPEGGSYAWRRASGSSAAIVGSSSGPSVLVQAGPAPSSSHRDHRFEVTYQPPDGSEPCSSGHALTVVDIDLDVDSDNDGQVGASDDPIEEAAPGMLVRIAEELGDIGRFRPLVVRRPRPADLPRGVLKLRKTAGAGKIRVTDGPFGSTLLAPDAIESGDLWDFVAAGGRELALEALEVGSVTLELVYSTAGGAVSTARQPTPTAKDTVAATAVKIDLDVFRVDKGAEVPDALEESRGTHLSINNDDDDGDGEPDNANERIDGDKDRRDMARLRLDVKAPASFEGKVRLTADNPETVRVFDESDRPIGLPAELDVSRFSAGPLTYLVEGLVQGTTILKLGFGDQPELEDRIKLVIGEVVTAKLTFDDGPHETLTPLVLSTLATNRIHPNLPAVFFVQTHAPGRGGSPIGEQLIRGQALEGHDVEIHTGSDVDHASHIERARDDPYDVTGDGVPDGQNGLESDLIRAKAKLKALTGRTPLLVRPPQGNHNPAVLATYARVGLGIKLWNVDSKDTQSCSTFICLEEALIKAIQGSIDSQQPPINLTILFHDTKSVTANNLEKLIKVTEDAVQHRGRNIKYEKFTRTETTHSALSISTKHLIAKLSIMSAFLLGAFDVGYSSNEMETHVDRILKRVQRKSGENLELLVSLGKPAVPAIIAQLATHDFPMPLVQALGLIGDSRAVPALLDLLETVEPHSPIAGDYEADRRFILRALRQIGDSQAAPMLQSIFENEEVYPGTRLEAAAALARIAEQPLKQDARDFIIRAAKDHKAGKFYQPTPEPPLIHGQDLDEALFEVGSDESKRILLDRLFHSNTYEQAPIIQHLASRLDEDVIEALLAFCEAEDQDRHLQLKAAKALIESGKWFSGERLLRTLPRIREGGSDELKAEVDLIEAELP
jgi:peptidoglycan/xylan/chitin deacetylase (PgdA/CDA1 family)